MLTCRYQMYVVRIWFFSSCGRNGSSAKAALWAGSPPCTPSNLGEESLGGLRDQPVEHRIVRELSASELYL